jgi:hypothetical protein
MIDVEKINIRETDRLEHTLPDSLYRIIRLKPT